MPWFKDGRGGWSLRPKPKKADVVVRSSIPDEPSTLTIPWPAVAPLGVRVDSRMLEETWEEFIIPLNADGRPQSAELRVLMGSLRALYKGLLDAEGRESRS